MSRLFYHVMQDNVGNLLFGVSGTMRIAGTGTAATIYGDAALTVPIPNPMTNHASFGSFKCYLSSGTYDFYMAKAGYNFETLTGLPGGGSMATQDAPAVAITGGTIDGLTRLNVTGTTGLGVAPDPTFSLAVGFSARIDGVTVLGPGVPEAATRLTVHGDTWMWNGLTVNEDSTFNATATHRYTKATTHALTVRPSDNDTGPGNAVLFLNLAGTPVGTIATTGSATAYNTSSDGRLKEAVEDLAGPLAIVEALRPVQFRWKADGSRGHGLVAQEVQAVVPDVVSAMGDAAGLLGIDYARLVPYLIGAVQELTQQVEMLTAKLAQASD